MYISDSRIGPQKHWPHIVFTLFWQRLRQQHPWIRRLSIFLDNSTSTNKNKFLFSWAMEMVSWGEVDHVHISLWWLCTLSLHSIDFPRGRECIQHIYHTWANNTKHEQDVQDTRLGLGYNLHIIASSNPRILWMRVLNNIIMCVRKFSSYTHEPHPLFIATPMVFYMVHRMN